MASNFAQMSGLPSEFDWNSTPGKPFVTLSAASTYDGSDFFAGLDTGKGMQNAMNVCLPNSVKLLVLGGTHAPPSTVQLPIPAGGCHIEGIGAVPGMMTIKPGAGFSASTPLWQATNTGVQSKDIHVESLNFDDGGVAFSGTMVDFTNPSGSGNFSSPGTHFRDIRVNCPNVAGRGVSFDFNYGATLTNIHVEGGPSAPTRTACSISINVDTGEVHVLNLQLKKTGGQPGSMYLRGNVLEISGTLGQYIMLDAKSVQLSQFLLDAGDFQQINIANLPNIDNISGTSQSLSGSANNANLHLNGGNWITDATKNIVGNSGTAGGNLDIWGGYYQSTGSSIAVQSAQWTRTIIGATHQLNNVT